MEYLSRGGLRCNENRDESQFHDEQRTGREEFVSQYLYIVWLWIRLVSKNAKISWQIGRSP
jgi:hypothetical protein